MGHNLKFLQNLSEELRPMQGMGLALNKQMQLIILFSVAIRVTPLPPWTLDYCYFVLLQWKTPKWPHSAPREGGGIKAKTFDSQEATLRREWGACVISLDGEWGPGCAGK